MSVCAEVFVQNTADVWFSLSRVVPVRAWRS